MMRQPELKEKRPCGRLSLMQTLIAMGAKHAIATLILLAPGCQGVMALPPQVQYSEIEPSGHAAKPPNCDMPVLRSDPLTPFRKVAIIEATGNVFAQESDVLPSVQRQACESGADAIIVLTSKSQTTEAKVGYYIDSVAIVYGEEPGAGVQSGFAPKLPR